MNILEYENYQEKTTHGSPAFPYITYPCSIPLDFSSVPLHWHDEAEIIYVKKGRGHISVDLAPHDVSTGDIAIVLPGQLHSIEQYEDASMEYENIIFDPNILFSRKADMVSADYLQPLLSGKFFLPTLYTPESPCYSEIAAYIDACDDVCRTCPDGYQLFIKGQLFLLFYTLFSKCRVNRRVDGRAGRHGDGTENAGVPHDASRNFAANVSSLEKIKAVLKYIENNYMNHISIADVAAEAGFSESHFMKYFKAAMGSSFVDYLNEYRLTMAARLLAASDSSILDIAAEVGFENLSYFNRRFKQRFKTTPSAYRKEHKII